MKLNRSTIFLLIALLAIWGGIVYIVYDKLSTHDIGPVITQHTSVKPLVDSFSLKLDYVDPFLQSSIGIKKSNNVILNPMKISTPNIEALVAKQPLVTQIRFNYLGLIDTKGKKNTSILLVVNGEEQFLQLGYVCEGYKVIAASENELTLKKGREILILRRDY